ncbi:DoxX family protein [Paraburkholderia sp. RL17-337-BIB-A]|uniref:DoxX family protein n=1 Tax=Paraburkholderia sp. RL17-337-BIB-A TaxID=3031636 RepID=UPI0038B9E28F
MRVLGCLAGGSVADSPSWVAALLRQPWVMPLVRICLVSAYLIGGVTKLMHFDAAVAEQVHFGLHPGWLWATLAIFVEIAGSLCIIFNRFTWVGAGGLAALTVVAMLVANNFWRLEGVASFIALNSFFEHLGLIAAFLMVTYLASGERRSRV